MRTLNDKTDTKNPVKPLDKDRRHKDRRDDKRD